MTLPLKSDGDDLTAAEWNEARRSIVAAYTIATDADLVSAISGALALGFKRIIIPSGVTYTITSTIDINVAGTTVEAWGSIIKKGAVTIDMVKLSAAGCRWAGGELDGNRTYFADTTTRRCAVIAADDCVFESVYMHDNDWSIMEFDAGGTTIKRSHLRNCRIESGRQGCVQFKYADGCSMVGGSILVKAVTINGACVQFYTNASNCRVEGVVMKWEAGATLGYGVVFGHATQDVGSSNNNEAIGCFIDSPPNIALYFEPSVHDNVAIGNIVKAPGQGGFFLFNSGSGNCLIGNSFTGLVTTGGQAAAPDTILKGNNFRGTNAGNIAIAIGDAAHRSQVIGNSVYGMQGVQVANSTDVVVIGNTFNGGGNNPTAAMIEINATTPLWFANKHTGYTGQAPKPAVLTESIQFQDDLEGIVLSGGGQLRDQASGNRTLLSANGDKLDVTDEAASVFIFSATPTLFATGGDDGVKDFGQIGARWKDGYFKGRVNAHGGLGVGNAVVATGPVGGITFKMAIYDEAGGLIGYIPIYNAIT